MSQNKSNKKPLQDSNLETGQLAGKLANVRASELAGKGG